jgi:hypothetical protein
VLLDGRDVTDTPLPFGAANQSIEGVDVVLTDRVSEVTGRVVDARGRGVADATVVREATFCRRGYVPRRHEKRPDLTFVSSCLRG